MLPRADNCPPKFLLESKNSGSQKRQLPSNLLGTMTQNRWQSGEEERKPQGNTDFLLAGDAEDLEDVNDAADDADFEKDISSDSENAEGAKHSNDDRVRQDMGTLALHPDLLSAPAEPHAGSRISQTAPMPGVTDKSAETGDAEVMLRLKAGELECFDYLMNKYRRPIVHFMFRMVHNQAVAEEMAQEVFLRVYRSRETYRAEARFSTWLYRIATNLAVNHARDTKNERLAPKLQLDEPDPETGSMHDVADATPTIEIDMLHRERMNAIKEHVMALPERQRMAVLMHKYQDMDYKAIGAVLKLSESATKSLLFRAYQTLRERLKDFV